MIFFPNQCLLKLHFKVNKYNKVITVSSSYSFYDQNWCVGGHDILDTLFLPKITLSPHHTTELDFLIMIFVGWFYHFASWQWLFTVVGTHILVWD